MATTGLSLLTFNIGNPSADRAQRQLAWLAGRDEHVLVLTETKASTGCQLLAEAFATCSNPVTGRTTRSSRRSSTTSTGLW